MWYAPLLYILSKPSLRYYYHYCRSTRFFLPNCQTHTYIIKANFLINVPGSISSIHHLTFNLSFSVSNIYIKSKFFYLNSPALQVSSFVTTLFLSNWFIYFPHVSLIHYPHLNSYTWLNIASRKQSLLSQISINISPVLLNQG